MAARTIAISSGHGLHVRGARGPAPWGLDEVNEARRVTNRIAELLRSAGVTCHVFHDDASRSVAANLNAIVNWHNSRTRTHDVSTHFNAFQVTQNARGTEVLHRTQPTWAATVSRAMASAGGFINRGAKVRTDLAFLNRTARPAILLEVAFVDSAADAALYHRNFEAICRALAETIADVRLPSVTPPVQPPAPPPVTPPGGQRPVLRRGSTETAAVRELQQLLNNHGAMPRLVVDGNFGPLTEAAVTAFQRRSVDSDGNQLVADGVVGPRTWSALIPPIVPTAPTGRNIVDLVIEPKSHEQVLVNGVVINESTSHDKLEVAMNPVGDVIVNLDGEDFHAPTPAHQPTWWERLIGRGS